MATVGVCMSGVVLNYFEPDKAFQYIMAAVTFVGLMVWIAILFTQMKFRRFNQGASFRAWLSRTLVAVFLMVCIGIHFVGCSADGLS